MNNYTLEEYKIQRQVREKKRKQYLNLFEQLRRKMGLKQNPLKNENANLISNISSQHLPVINHSIPIAAPLANDIKDISSEQQKLLQQNAILKMKMSQLDKSQRQKLQKFKQKIGVAKQNYLTKIKDIKSLGMIQKSEIVTKIKKIQQQISNSTNKNTEIQSVNKKIEQQQKKGEQTMQKYSIQIKKQYDQKLQEFNKIFNTSTQKINQMENQCNDDDFVQVTLKNNDMMKNIQTIAQKTDVDLDKMVASYQELFKGKQQILQQLLENNKMKEDQIAKMSDLQQKLNAIFKKMSEEKSFYVQENQKMFSELMEIKKLLAQTMEE